MVRDFSRELGKRLHEILGKDVEFERPSLVILYDMVKDEVRLQINRAAAELNEQMRMQAMTMYGSSAYRRVLAGELRGEAATEAMDRMAKYIETQRLYSPSQT